MIWLLSALRISEKKRENVYRVYRNAAEPTKPKFVIQIQIRQNIHESADKDGK